MPENGQLNVAFVDIGHASMQVCIVGEKKQWQDSLPKPANLVLLSAEIRKKVEVVHRFCKPILMKPKPAKPVTPPAPPSPTSSGSEQQLNPA
ncbi:hypothetical protein KIW84_074984 [Lathyrus oleraceus]|uniref:Uncharacterized protein n=1 Tax=Pisum sativum TaxID=3888 RepID=A0A9D4ZZB1_PEA|nr:hypothetical protein KIW84_074984 [Pisum sativum]